MKTTHNSQRSDLAWSLILFPLILLLFAFGQRYVNHQKAQFIKEVRVDGQGR